MIDNPAVEWGIHIDRVEIKDVALPETMKRSMSRQAEAERERRDRIISAEGELQASDRLAQAAATMADTPGPLQLRLLETIVEVAAEKNSTLVLPFPVELLRFLENNTSLASAISAAQAATNKTTAVAGTASPDVKERLASAPQVAAIAARESEGTDQPAAHSTKHLSPLRRGRSSAQNGC